MFLSHNFWVYINDAQCPCPTLGFCLPWDLNQHLLKQKESPSPENLSVIASEIHYKTKGKTGDLSGVGPTAERPWLDRVGSNGYTQAPTELYQLSLKKKTKKQNRWCRRYLSLANTGA